MTGTPPGGGCLARRRQTARGTLRAREECRAVHPRGKAPRGSRLRGAERRNSDLRQGRDEGLGLALAATSRSFSAQATGCLHLRDFRIGHPSAAPGIGQARRLGRQPSSRPSFGQYRRRLHDADRPADVSPCGRGRRGRHADRGAGRPACHTGKPRRRSRAAVRFEAETGSGKTEAALWRHAALRASGSVEGLCFVLPTRSAARQLHGRVGDARRPVFRDPPEAVPATRQG